MPDFLKINKTTIAYEKTAGKLPGVMFCGGFASDMSGTKALALEGFCRELGHAYVRFDYQGHGLSSGKFSDGTIGMWFADALAVFDQVAEGPQILVGSSMGGWIALLLALARPARVKAFIGIAAAPDFTEDLIWEKLSAEKKAALLSKGIIYEGSDDNEQGHVIARQFIEEARQHLLLRDVILLKIPVRLLQGMRDQDVPWQRSALLAEKLQSDNVKILLVKDGDHRLARDQDLKILRKTLTEFL